MADQLAKLEVFINKYKDNPAILCWGIGNEVEFGATNSAQTVAVWKAINTASELVRRLDPNHPTMTVVADVGKDMKSGKATEIKKYAPSIQVKIALLIEDLEGIKEGIVGQVFLNLD